MKRLALFLLISYGAFAQAPTITVSPSSVQEGQTVTATCTANCTGLTWKVNGITGGNSTVGTISGNDTSATYTAPASIVAQNAAGGCQLYPNDAIWNTPVNTLPYLTSWHGLSMLNDSYFMNYLNGKLAGVKLSITNGIGTTLVNNSTQLVPIQSNYGGYKDLMAVPLWPYREASAYIQNGNKFDHHTSIVNTDTCDLHELYNDGNNPAQCTGDGAGTKNCWLASSTVKNASSTKYTWTGGTDAANNPILPYVVRLDEVKRGVINHALRMDFPQGDTPGPVYSVSSIMWPASGATGWGATALLAVNVVSGGSNYSAGTTAALIRGSGDTSGTGATISLTISGGVITAATVTNQGGNYKWPFTGSVQITDPLGTGSGASLSAVVDWPMPPYGARYILDPTYFAQHAGAGCSAGTKCLTGAGLVVAQALATYGMAMNDNGGNGAISLYGSSDLSLDQTVMNQIASQSSGIGTLTINDFHIVDTSALSTCGDCANSRVSPTNTESIVPPNAIWITATNASGTSSVPTLAPVAPTIGVESTEIYILAGDYSGSKGTSGGYQIKSWVNNSPGGTAITWSCSTCAANGSALSSSGIYTPPLTEATTGLQDVAVATLTADTNITATVYINILPNSGNYQANTIRIDSGNSSNYGPDGNGHYWLKDQGIQMGDKTVESDGSWKWYSGTGENSVYATNIYGQSSDENRYRFIVPNGNYTVRMMSGWGGGTSISTTAWNHMPEMVLATNYAVPVIEGFHWNPMEGASHPYAQQSNSDFVFGETVTDNVLNASIAGDSPASDWPTCSNTCAYYTPTIAGVDIEPDTAASHWAILSTTTPAQNGTPFLSNKSIVSLGGSIYLYLQDWHTGLSDAVWSVASGPGSITTENLQVADFFSFPVAVYTAPSTPPRGDVQPVVKACSQSNPAICATLNVTIAGPNTGVNSSAVTIK